MNTDVITTQLSDIHAKLDAISAELEINRRQRQEMQELKSDLSLIAKDVFNTAVDELEDVAPFVQTGDFMYLVKKLLRNTNNIIGMMEKLESTVDFIEDVRPIGQSIFRDTILKLDELDRRGYFEFLSELTKVLDNVVQHFSAEDIKLLADNVVTILETVKDLTQPDMLKAINNAVQVYRHIDLDHVKDISVFKAMKEMNSPEVKRGIGFLMTFIKNIARASNKITEETKELNHGK